MVQTGSSCARRHGALGMLIVETIAKVRRLHFVEGKGIKRIYRETGLARETVRGIVRAGPDGPTERHRRLSAQSLEVDRRRCQGEPHRLSITHISRPYIDADLDVGQAGQPAPHDRVAGWWIAGSGEIAAEARELGQIMR